MWAWLHVGWEYWVSARIGCRGRVSGALEPTRRSRPRTQAGIYDYSRGGVPWKFTLRNLQGAEDQT